MVWLPFLLRRPGPGAGAAVASVALGVDPIASIDRSVSPVDVSFDIDIHIVVNPSTIPIAVVCDDSSPRHADAESDQWRVWVVNIGWRRIIHRWGIGWHIDDLWVGRGHLHDLVCDGHYLSIIGLPDHNVRNTNNLLLRGSKCAGFLRLGAQLLDRVH